MSIPAVVPAKIKAARLSVLSNFLLVLLKLGVGLSIGSVAVLSEALHSATDLLAAFIAFFAVRSADAPPDEQHPYGHGKMESLSGAIEALLIISAGIFIVIKAIQSLLEKRSELPVTWGIAVMVFSAIINIGVARYLFMIARETDSAALEADAHHLSVDVWTSAGVTVGLIVVHFTHNYFFDPIVALIVAGFILQTGARIFRESSAPLLDVRLPEAEIQEIERIMDKNPAVLSWHKLRTRKSGSHRHVDVHIQVDDDMSLREAHRLTEDLEDQMRDALHNLHVVIHTEPYEEERDHQERFHRTTSNIDPTPAPPLLKGRGLGEG